MPCAYENAFVCVNSGVWDYGDRAMVEIWDHMREQHRAKLHSRAEEAKTHSYVWTAACENVEQERKCEHMRERYCGEMLLGLKSWGNMIKCVNSSVCECREKAKSVKMRPSARSTAYLNAEVRSRENAIGCVNSTMCECREQSLRKCIGIKEEWCARMQEGQKQRQCDWMRGQRRVNTVREKSRRKFVLMREEQRVWILRVWNSCENAIGCENSGVCEYWERAKSEMMHPWKTRPVCKNKKKVKRRENLIRCEDSGL